MSKHRSTAFYLSGLGALLISLLGVWAMAARRSSREASEVDSRTQERARGTRVRVAIATPSPDSRTLLLQGEARPFQTVTLYAKVSGYLTSIRVDKGDRVRANQLLATIASPELDQQFLGATADAKNKRAAAERTTALAPAGVVSKQELDLARANADVAEASQASLASQRDYRNIRAPFAGVVSARFADPGALIQSAANGQSGAAPLVTVSDNDRLRVYVYLDQQSAALVRVGDPAEIHLAERPGFSRPARVTRIAGELAPRTRTMLTEVDLDNRDGAIFAGSFVEVVLHVKAPSFPEIPVEGLIMRGDKAQVAVVDPNGRLHLRPVVLSTDDGKAVRIAEGLQAGERVALNLGNEAEDGQHVEIVPPSTLPSARAAAANLGGPAVPAKSAPPASPPAGQ